eukprot:TRINITY_DN188_c0_g1_i1.p1 TRINITY_DN188_c0_g1~~TRINITY_DN188_c0_g1_i1.p1  ORF type:complete len:210 (+),score=18.84 TRINITY_DN188_c0_g1_i1:50-679(+)
MSDYDFLCKILLVGGLESGKSSFLIRFTDDVYNPEVDTSLTDEPSFKIKKMQVGNRLIKLQMWDVHPKDRKNITGSYFRGAQGIILVFSLYSQQSFEELKSWHKEIESDISTTGVKKLMIGHHYDSSGKNESRVTSTEDAKELAKNSGYMYAEANSMTGENVQESMGDLITEIVKEKEELATKRDLDESLIGGEQEHSRDQACHFCLLS